MSFNPRSGLILSKNIPIIMQDAETYLSMSQAKSQEIIFNLHRESIESITDARGSRGGDGSTNL